MKFSSSCFSLISITDIWGLSVSIVYFNLAQSLQCSAETYLPFPVCCFSVPDVIGWHNSKFTCQKPGNHIFTFYLLLLSLSSQFSDLLASISLIPFVVYLSVDSQQYCLISGCITSHLDYYFLTTHSFLNLIPVYPHFIYIGNLNWIMSLRFSEIFMDSVPAREKADSPA